MSKFAEITDEIARRLGIMGNDLEDYENYIEIREKLDNDKSKVIWELSENAGETADFAY